MCGKLDYEPGNSMSAWKARRDDLAKDILVGWCKNSKVVVNPKTSPGAAFDLADEMITLERRRARL